MHGTDDRDPKTYEDTGERARDVPQDGEKARPPQPADPQHMPGKKQPPAHQDARSAAGTKIWDEDSQRLMESLDVDRKQATDEDYHEQPASGVTRGDAGVD